MTGIRINWLAITNEPADSWDDQVKAYMDTFIAIFCWYMALLPKDLKWMDDLHRHLVFHLGR